MLEFDPRLFQDPQPKKKPARRCSIWRPNYRPGWWQAPGAPSSPEPSNEDLPGSNRWTALAIVVGGPFLIIASLHFLVSLAVALSSR